MAGNILYIPYSVFIIIALIVFSVIIGMKKGRDVTKKFLAISIPFFILIQLYFWNIDFNNLVKSFLFSSEVYECDYHEELNDLSIPLPKRTVFKGKEDVCSPFYSTYVDDKEFNSFYKEVLGTLKSNGEIESYRYVDENEGYWTEKKGFSIELTSGSIINLLIYREESSNKWMISINYTEN